MPLYEYRCQTCGTVETIACDVDSPEKQTWDSKQVPCGPPCTGTFKRRFGFSLHLYQAHFNEFTGRFTPSHRAHVDNLKRASEDAYERTGIPHDYQPVDLDAPGVAPTNDNAAREFHDKAVKAGAKPPAAKLLH